MSQFAWSLLIIEGPGLFLLTHQSPRRVTPPPPEIRRACYVLAEHHGTGAASQLITDLLGAESASLWVFEGNPRARRFYEKHGFTADGKSCDLGEAEQDEEIRGIKEIRMVRAEPGRAPVQ